MNRINPEPNTPAVDGPIDSAVRSYLLANLNEKFLEHMLQDKESYDYLMLRVSRSVRACILAGMTTDGMTIGSVLAEIVRLWKKQIPEGTTHSELTAVATTTLTLTMVTLVRRYGMQIEHNGVMVFDPTRLTEEEVEEIREGIRFSTDVLAGISPNSPYLSLNRAFLEGRPFARRKSTHLPTSVDAMVRLMTSAEVDLYFKDGITLS